MGDRAAKDAPYREFAAVGKALGNPGRLELLDLLAQRPRSVEELADAAGRAMSTCSAPADAPPGPA
jgi:DNA-binding transcriptional ArsR family regulator